MKSIKDLITDYLDKKRTEGTPASSLKTLRWQLGMMGKYLDNTGVGIENFRIKDALNLMSFLSEYKTLKGKNLSTYTLSFIITSVKLFFKDLKEEGIIISNPFSALPALRMEKKLPKRPLNEKDMEKLLSSLFRYDRADNLAHLISNYQVYVLAELLYSTGMRAGEAAGLKVTDIDLSRSEVLVRKGKGGTQRICFLNSYANKLCRDYLKRVRVLILSRYKKSDLLFGVEASTLKKKINRRLKDVCEDAGLRKQTSHSFRHAFGAHFLRSGCDLRQIQEFLGHRKLKTTQVYTQLEKEDLKKVLDSHHPRSFKEKL